ncbi:deoxyribose-phosphate aldolase [Salinispira pacifica]
MKLDSESLAQMIDISAVQAPHGEAEVRVLAERAHDYHFKAVHVLPCWVRMLRDLIGDSRYSVVGAPVGFPGGGHTTGVKLAEARELIQDGVQEMDMMLNVGRHRSGDYAYVENEVKAVVSLAHEHAVPVKVILEVHYLTPDQIRRACEMCIGAGAEFVKTSTGWAPSGATLDVVKLITDFVGDAIQVKAAGGVRDLDTVRRMYEMGVRRFGINIEAASAILRECASLPAGSMDL